MDSPGYREYGSPHLRHQELRLGNSSARRSDDVDAWRQAGRAGSSASLVASGPGPSPGARFKSTPLTVLRELKAELRLLDGSLSRLTRASAQSVDAGQQQLELDEPLRALESGVLALREASRERFEASEEHLAALSENNAALSEHCFAIKKRKASAAGAASRPAKRAKRSSHLGTPESGECTSEPELQPRSRSSVKQIGAENTALSSAAGASRRLKSAVSTPPSAKDWFITPEWAKSVSLQQEPLAEGREFVSVMRAFKAALDSPFCTPNQPSKNCVVSASAVAYHLGMIDPGLLNRHGVKKWSALLPIAQKFLAVHVILPPLQRDLKRCKAECLLLENLHEPWYARATEPPAFKLQVAAVCTQIGLSPEAWTQRSHRGPLERTPECRE